MNTEEEMRAAGGKTPDAEQTEEQARTMRELEARLHALTKEASAKVAHEQKIGMVRELHVGLQGKIEEVTSMINLLERGTGARELALVKTKLQEAKHWAAEALNELHK